MRLFGAMNLLAAPQYGAQAELMAKSRRNPRLCAE
jgi:hypothetical protein